MKKLCFALVPPILGGKMSLSYRIFIMTMAVIGITGCATPPIVFEDISGETRNMQGLLNDRYECLQESSSDGSQISGSTNSLGAEIYGSSGLTCNSSIFSACLAARGWLRNDSALALPNAIIVPPGAVVQCSN